MAEVISKFKSLLNEDISVCPILLCYASLKKGENIPLFEKIQMSKELAEYFRKVVGEFLGRWEGDSDIELVKYDPIRHMDSHQIDYLELSDQEFVKNQLKSLTETGDIITFENDEKFTKNLHFYVIIIQVDGGEPIFCFRKYSSKQQINQGKKFGMRWSKDCYDRITESAFLFDEKLDCISQGNLMFLFQKTYFHSIFRFFDELKKLADETLGIISSKVPIKNFDEFSAKCKDHYQKLAKLRNISQKSYLDSITIDDMKKVIGEFNRNIKIAKVNGQEKLVYDSSNPWEILRLLDDDFLASDMTKEKYEVNSKHVI